ncbi:DNA polymerase III subunit alpha [Candidatus Tremblaya princeps]|uniref:DNA polymerase III subunit alpha n=1 Tax=Tremblaya princeps TaxID=189385 RepID=A0A143WQU9_TREPR|nr:DNA polymerase III subunit alpha [Candidatus Tremblaya princeps]
MGLKPRASVPRRSAAETEGSAMAPKGGYHFADFVHLRMHSEYSMHDGMVRVEDAVREARADMQCALALTDLNNVCGAVKFYKAAVRSCVKPIVGCHLLLRGAYGETSSILALARGGLGFRNLCQILTSAWYNAATCMEARVDVRWLNENPRILQGIVVLSGALYGPAGQHIVAGNARAARRAVDDWLSITQGSFYLELQRCGHGGTEAYIHRALELSIAARVPVVATHPIQFMAPSDYPLHCVRCIMAAAPACSGERAEFTKEQHFKSRESMSRLFQDIPSALANTCSIARMCNLSMEVGRIRRPVYAECSHTFEADLLACSLGEGMRARLAEGRIPRRTDLRRVYAARIEDEYSIVAGMGFCGYFLVVADFVRWAKARGIPVGPGRGSGAGSLMAYVLGITDIDPIAHGLLFERFLNPERVSMPDIDIDFCQEGRDRVVQYVSRRYGYCRVAHITTFGTMAARAAVREAARAIGVSYAVSDGIARLVPIRPACRVTIQDSLKEVRALRARYASEADVRLLVDTAARMEGLVRSMAVHAGGVIISPTDIQDLCPLYPQSSSVVPVSQLDKDDVESLGLVKFDFLGLTTLTILSCAACGIARGRAVGTHAMRGIPYDAAAFGLLQAADTIAVFQLEGVGMQEALRSAVPDRLGDIIALIALYRPGPMHLVRSYCRRKHGIEEARIVDEQLRPILGETYGVMVYQEQVMRIAQAIGGYTPGEADLLRRVMSRKQPADMAAHRISFVLGAARLGICGTSAVTVFAHMEKFASYGFNKSHAAAYATLSYQTAWVKARHPVEFIAANMSWSLGDYERIRRLRLDSARRGVLLLPPDVNRPAYRFTPMFYRWHRVRGAIVYGLGAVKSSGDAAVRDIARCREDRPFVGLSDFLARINSRVVKRSTIECLVKAGAFLYVNTEDRLVMLERLHAIPHAMSYSTALHCAAAHGNERALSDNRVVYYVATECKSSTQLQHEREALGYFFSYHPFGNYRAAARRMAPMGIEAVRRRARMYARHIICGVVVSVGVRVGQVGKRGVLVLEDDTDYCLVHCAVREVHVPLRICSAVVVTGRVSISNDRERMSLTAVSMGALVRCVR